MDALDLNPARERTTFPQAYKEAQRAIGDILVESAPSAGSTFTLRLPAAM